MNYEQAKAIIAEHPTKLLVDGHTGARHLCVRRTEKGTHFNIMLPSHTLGDDTVKPEDIEASERKELSDALDQAAIHLPE